MASAALRAGQHGRVISPIADTTATTARAATAPVAIVLPPKEGFSPDAVGAIGLLVHRLVRAGAPGIVLGRAPVGAAFADVPFVPVRPGLGLSSVARYAAGVAREVRRLQPALIEVHNRPEVALRLQRLGVPTSLFLHNDPVGMRGAPSAADRARLLGHMARVVTVSAWLRERFLLGVANPVRTPVVLPNCIDVPEIDATMPAGVRDPVVLFAGRVVADKGADLFVDACGQALPSMPGWRAQVIGADRFGPHSPDTPFLRGLRLRAAAAGVALLGHQSHDRVLAAMRRAAIVCVPSRWDEPFGLTALEAMACGAALVCSSRGGLPEVAGDAALYAEPEVAALSAAILALAGDPARRAALGAAGQRRAAGFSAPAAAQALVRLRRDILG